MNRRRTQHWLPNDTPVVYIGGTLHQENGTAGRAACGAEEGRPTTLVQALVYVSAQWCPRPVCFPHGRP